MKILGFYVVITILSLGTLAIADPQQGKTYELSQDQKLRLKGQQSSLNTAYQQWQEAIAAFNAESKAIEKENGWPETLQVNPQTLAFSDPPPVPAKLSDPAPAAVPNSH